MDRTGSLFFRKEARITLLKRSMFIVFFILSVFSFKETVAEGTKEIMPYDTCISRLSFSSLISQFAVYGCTPEERLNIHIANVGEKVYYGFGDAYDYNQYVVTDMVYRIKDPNGNVVVNQTNISSLVAGHIYSYSEAVAGPNTFNTAGYNPLVFTPTMTGDYYMEFYYPLATSPGSHHEIEYFDITVANANNQPIKGRVWSKEWQFTVTVSPYPNSYDYPFYGEMYIYSDDSIVTSVDFNGMKPLVFTMTANSTGTDNTGSIIVDRKSKVGKHTYPQYKIFLNDPDSIVYPSGDLGVFTSPLGFAGCAGNQCIYVHTNKSGAIQLLIDLNGIPGYQIGTKDLLIVQNVNAGTTCVPWNGNDGLGNPVANGTPVDFHVVFVAGLTHMPIYDAETNPNGYIINLVRPISSSTVFSLYWDDTNFSGGSSPSSTGCVSTSGCHQYGVMFGDLRTINTWWYSASNVKDSLPVVFYRLEVDSVNKVDASCPNIADGSIDVFITGGANPILYSLNGGTPQSSPSFPNQMVGNYVLTITDSVGCIWNDTLDITSSPSLIGLTTMGNDTCMGANGFASVNVNSGVGPYQYSWNTTPPILDSVANNLLPGVYTVSVTDSFNCVFTFTDTVLNVPTAIQVTPTILHDTCSNNMGQISLIVSNAIQPLTFSWNTTPVQTSDTISNLGAGTYSVTLSENATCFTTLNYVVLNMPAPSPLFSIQDKACVGDSIIVQYIGNQTPPDNFQWSFGGLTTLNGTGIGPYVLVQNQIGTYYINLGVSKQGCLSSDLTDSVKLFELLSSLDSSALTSCFGTSDGYLSVDVKGGVKPYNYNWNPGGVGSSFNNNLPAGVYTIHIVDSIGCESNYTDTVRQPDLLTIQFSQKKASCVYRCDGTLTGIIQGGTQPYSYQWTPSGLGITPVITQLCTGKYSLKVVDKNNCVDTASFQVQVNSPVLAQFNYQIHPAFSERNIVDFSFTGFGATDYLWDFGDMGNSVLQNPTHTYLMDTNYQIELIVNSGVPDFCEDTAYKWITILPPFSIFIPDAFTPNGDGLNDRFNVVANYIKEYHILIFNRWGELVFESRDINDSWNGTYKKEKAPLDVYTYIIEVVGTNNKSAKRYGSISLIR